ncbi:MAG: hypothetical protein JXB07_02665 [Anaerolineae bacterium]|nr:hypothetical protein [Anaerolineae bacterium]
MNGHIQRRLVTIFLPMILCIQAGCLLGYPAAQITAIPSPTVTATLPPTSSPTASPSATPSPTTEPSPTTSQMIYPRLPRQSAPAAQPTETATPTRIPTLAPGTLIKEFVASPPAVDPGESFTLSWKTIATRAVLCRFVEHGGGSVTDCHDVSLNGARQVHTDHQTYNQITYALYAYYGDSETNPHEVVFAPVQVYCRDTWMLDYPPSTCPRRSGLLTEGTIQYFEHGLMVWLRGNRMIYVLFKDDNSPGFYNVSDDWYPGLPESDPTIVLPLGAYQPTHGFGRVWRGETSIGNVRDRLGWAVAPETSYTAILQCDTAEEEICYLTGPEWVAVLNWSRSIWSIWLGPSA